MSIMFYSSVLVFIFLLAMNVEQKKLKCFLMLTLRMKTSLFSEILCKVFAKVIMVLHVLLYLTTISVTRNHFNWVKICNIMYNLWFS